MYHISIAPGRTEGFADQLALCRRLGVVNLELDGTLDGVPFSELSAACLEDARAALIDSGVRIVLAAISADPRDDAALRRFFRAAFTLHVESVLLPVPAQGVTDAESFAECWTTAARYAKSYGMGVLVSNDAESFLSTDEALTAVVRALDRFDCGAVFDGVAYQKTGLYPFFGACYKSHIKNRIRVLRIGDLHADGTPARLDRGACGLREVTSLLLARSFDGYFSLSASDLTEEDGGWETLLRDTRTMLKTL